MDVDHRIFSFAGCTLDVTRGALSRDGHEQHLRPKSYAVLRYLVEHAGRLVGKQELLDAVWGSTVVTEGSLTQCIIDIRRAIGDSDQRLLRTIPRQGFILDTPVAASELHPGSPAAGPRVLRSRAVAGAWLGLLLLAGAVAWLLLHRTAGLAPDGADVPRVQAPDKSIAVLRFLDLSPEGDQAYFADGLAEEILHLLSQSPDLKVIARSSSFAFDPGSLDIATVASELDVTHVLEGSVRRAGDRLRITVQLIDSATRAHVWSRTYDRTPARLLAVQGEVAADVASALAVSLRLPPISTSPDAAPAQEYYLLGRHLFLRRGPGDLDAAERHFRRAVELDPQHARAWTALAGVFAARPVDESSDPEHQLEEQRAVLERALAIDPALAEAHVRLARYFRIKGDPAAAEAAFERARQLAPGEPLVIAAMARLAMLDGRLEAAIELQRRLCALDPLSAVYRGSLAHLLMRAGRYEAALSELRRTQALSPENPSVRTDLALALLLLDRIDEAREVVAGASASPRVDQLQCLLGPADEAAAACERLRADDSAYGHFLLAEIAAHRGDTDAAFGSLSAALRVARPAGSGMGFDLGLEMAISPFLRERQADPRWRAMTEGMPGQ